MKKVLVIGCNSFSASSFINYLLNKKYIVIGVSRSNQKKAATVFTTRMMKISDLEN